MGVGAVLLTAFALYELKVSRDPVLDLRLYARRDFGVASVVAWIATIVVFGSIFILPIFLEQVRGFSALDTGLALMPQGLAAAVAVLLSGRVLYNRIGPRNLVLIGSVLLIISSWRFIS